MGTQFEREGAPSATKVYLDADQRNEQVPNRSQFATIALSAAGNPLGVCAGATAGHFLATGTAVIAGSYLSNYLSERGILTLGGVLFLIFAFTTAFGIF